MRARLTIRPWALAGCAASTRQMSPIFAARPPTCWQTANTRWMWSSGCARMTASGAGCARAALPSWVRVGTSTNGWACSKTWTTANAPRLPSPTSPTTIPSPACPTAACCRPISTVSAAPGPTALCSISIWTGSSRSTIPWATRQAMHCCARWPNACVACCATPIWWCAWAGTNSASCKRPPPRTPPPAWPSA
ncbi:hypothetical protein D3C72_1826050 [compost metagenome]